MASKNKKKKEEKKRKLLKTMKEESFSSQDEMENKETKFLPQYVSKNVDSKGIVTYFSLSFDENPHIMYAVKVFPDLTVEVFFRNVNVTSEYVKTDNRICSCSQIRTIFANLELRYNNISPKALFVISFDDGFHARTGLTRFL